MESNPAQGLRLELNQSVAVSRSLEPLFFITPEAGVVFAFDYPRRTCKCVALRTDAL